MNVCYHLMKMDVDSTIITQVGNDADGRAIKSEMDRLGIDGLYCFTSAVKPTSTVEVRFSGTNNAIYEIVEDVSWDDIRITNAVEELVKESDAFVYGSLVARSLVSRETLLYLLSLSSRRVFDINLRSPYYDKSLITELITYADLLKLNEDELKIVSGWLGINGADVIEQLNGILQNFPNLKEILYTRGEDGAVYCSHEGVETVEALKVIVQDTVGSGDSFLAAFLATRFRGMGVKQALRSAASLSGFIATQKGACPEYDPSKINGIQL